MASLYELKESYQTIQDLIEEGGDYEAVLATINDEIEVKAENYAIVMKNMNGDIEAIDKEIERLSKRKQTLSNGVQRMKDMLFRAMVETGKTKFKTKLFSFAVVKNGGKAPLVYDDEKKVPKKYLIATYRPDTEKIREDLDAGKKLKWVSYGERKESLRIK